ncbi:MAG: hypothetical protein WAK91_07535 [Candidatus Acidiferrales bacterium]
MAKATQRFRSQDAVSNSMLAMAGAGLLIFLGVMFQLGELGYSRLSPANFWLATMVTEDVWNVLAMHFDAPAFQQLLMFWPLVFVALGMALLLVTKRGNKVSPNKVSAGSRGNDDARQ